MRVSVRFFASARDAAGTGRVELDLPDGAVVRQAADELARRFAALAPLLPRVRFAVNQEYAAPSTTLRDADELAVIPPVSGG